MPTWTSRDDHRLDADDGRPPDPLPRAATDGDGGRDASLRSRGGSLAVFRRLRLSVAATSPDLRDHLRDHLRDDHAVAIRDGRTDAETAACDARLAAARARVASFSTRVRAAGGGVGGVATLPDTHGDYGTLRRRGDAWTAFNKRPDRIRDALAADPNLPRCPHLVGNAPSRLPHVIVSHRDAPGLSRAALGAEGRVPWSRALRAMLGKISRDEAARRRRRVRRLRRRVPAREDARVSPC